MVDAARTILTTTQLLNAPNPLSLLFTRLYRDATRFHKGKHVKDLKNLNRDLRKVNLSWIGLVAYVLGRASGSTQLTQLAHHNRCMWKQVVIVDDDPDAFQFQPENGIRIKAFTDPKDKGDRSLDKLRQFLLAVVLEGVSDDIPSVLRQFEGMDADAMGDAYAERLRRAKIREAEKHMKGLGGLLRKQKAFQGVANPFAGAPGGSGAAEPHQPRGLSAKDIVGGAPKPSQEAGAGSGAPEGLLPSELQQHQQSAPPPAGPVKKGKLWERYQNYLKEAEEDQRRKLELWQRKQAQREEEARRAALQQQAAGAGR